MKFISLLIGLILSLNALATAPLGVSGQQDTSNQYPSVIKVPQKLATKTTTGLLIENGNKNILTNPDFEHATIKTGWGSSTFSVSYSTETSDVKSGSQTLKVTFSGGNLNVSQDSTSYATAYADGLQGLGMLWVKTAVTSTPLYVCPRNAGSYPSTISSSTCVTVNADGKWHLYKIPFILGGTSNGIGVTSNSVNIASGTVLLDDAFVGAIDLKQDVDQSRIAGESYFAGTTSCNWARTSTTIGAFSAVAACPGPTVVSSNMGSWQTTDSDLPRQTINNLPAGTYKAKFIIKAAMTANAVMGFAINDGTTTCEPHGGVDILTGYVGQVVECTFVYTSSGNRVFELYAGSASSTVNILNSATTPRVSAKFILEYFGNSSVYTAQNADTDWQACNFSTLAWQGLGTVTSALECRKQGGDLLMRGSFTVGTPAAAEARIPLPIFGGQSLTLGGANGFSVGRLLRNDATASTPKDFTAWGTAGQTYLKIGLPEYATATSPFTANNGNTYFASGVNIFFDNIRIPISGWQNSNVIIGTFKDAVTSQGSNSADIQSVYFGGNASCSTNCTTGTCTICNQVGSKITSVTWNATGTYNINGIDGTKYNCNGNGLAISVGPVSVYQDRPSSTSSLARVVSYGASSVQNSAYNSVTCIGTP